MKQVLIRQGQANVEDVPAPRVEPGTILVAVDHSCISAGTELSGIADSGEPLWRKAIRQPQKVAKVASMVATQGLARTRSIVEGKLSAGAPTGYSVAGTVLEVGDGVREFRPGDRVACAGAQCAHHAQVVRVPVNLAAPVPDGLELAPASTVTLGAIALQGVRRLEPTLGESIVVVGLGLLGQLTVQMLRANGCTTIGSDLDPRRLEIAAESGLDAALAAGDPSAIEQVMRRTDGHGADGVVVTAAARSDAIMSAAFQMCRRKGRVVLVGDVGLNLQRADFYQKEIDFRISTSYGPGRYDARYEEEGLDYPIAYVRWTENRNMRAYLDLLATGRVALDPMQPRVHPVAEAEEAYRLLQGQIEPRESNGGGDEPPARPLLALLRYPPLEHPGDRPSVPNPAAPAPVAGVVRIGLVGAGAFAREMHLPNLGGLSDRGQLTAVCSRTGHNAAATAKQFGAGYSCTDPARVFADDDVDAVIIATRHDVHTPLAIGALEAGKHVLLEKPLAIDRGQLDDVRRFFTERDASESPTPILLTGFNRRFSPHASRIRTLVADRTSPMMITYRMNAGHLPADHWTHGPEGGGRNIGEACHIYDLFTALTDSPVVDVVARSIRPSSEHDRTNDNFSATITFEDGSVAALLYTALGVGTYPKERMEVFVDGRVLELDNYEAVRVHGGAVTGLQTRRIEKGQREELVAFLDAARGGGPWPIPLWQQIQATEIALRVEEQL